jgi:membrane protease YdiL (CAAX protease family)
MERSDNQPARKNPAISALVEIGVLFLPAVPAYIWLWPNLSGVDQLVVQSIVYLYILAGTLFIGLRRWTWSQLGINKKGIGISLASGLVILTGRLMIILSIRWGVHPAQLTLLGVISDLLFYFGLVALGEELLFRGLVYRLLEDWLGLRWAILGSSFGFLLWHIFGQGPLIGITMFLVGLVLALIRWRAGGILGLIILHGFYDLETVWLVAGDNNRILSQGAPQVISLTWIYIGLALLVGVPVYLWKIHPWLQRLAARRGEKALPDNVTGK